MKAVDFPRVELQVFDCAGRYLSLANGETPFYTDGLPFVSLETYKTTGTNRYQLKQRTGSICEQGLCVGFEGKGAIGSLWSR